MNTNVLDGVVAFVSCPFEQDNSTANAVRARLASSGARTVSRLSKEVTHIVFKRKLHPTEDEKAREDAEIRCLYEKASKVVPPPLVVTPSWVESSLQQGKRAIERSFIVTKPPEHMLKHTTRTPLSSLKRTGSAIKPVGSTARKPRRRQIADIADGASPSAAAEVNDQSKESEHADGQQHASKRARTTYHTTSCAPGAATAWCDENALTIEEQPAPHRGVATTSSLVAACPTDKQYVSTTGRSHLPLREANANLDSSLMPPPRRPRSKTSFPTAITTKLRHALSPSMAVDSGDGTVTAFAIAVEQPIPSVSEPVRQPCVPAAPAVVASNPGVLNVAPLGVLGPVPTAAMQGVGICTTHTTLNDAGSGHAAATVGALGGSLRSSSGPYVSTAAAPLHSSSSISSHGQHSALAQYQRPALGTNKAPSPPAKTNPLRSSPARTSSGTTDNMDVSGDGDDTEGSDPHTAHANSFQDNQDGPQTCHPSLFNLPRSMSETLRDGEPERCSSPPGSRPTRPPTAPTPLVSEMAKPSPSRPRQVWQVPVAIEARRSSSDVPAWQLLAENMPELPEDPEDTTAPGAAAPGSDAAPRQPDAAPHQPIRAPSPSRSLSRSGSGKGGAAATATAAAAALAQQQREAGQRLAALSLRSASHTSAASDDQDMMLGGVPPIVAKSISPAGKLATRDNFHNQHSVRSSGSRTAMARSSAGALDVHGSPSKTPGAAAMAAGSRAVTALRSSACARLGEADAKPAPGALAPSSSVHPAADPRGSRQGALAGPGKAAKAAGAGAAERGPAAAVKRSSSVPAFRPGGAVPSHATGPAQAPASRGLRSSAAGSLRHSITDTAAAGGGAGAGAGRPSRLATASGVSSAYKLHTHKPRVATALPTAAAQLSASADAALAASDTAAAAAAPKLRPSRQPSIADKHTAASLAKLGRHAPAVLAAVGGAAPGCGSGSGSPGSASGTVVSATSNATAPPVLTTTTATATTLNKSMPSVPAWYEPGRPKSKYVAFTSVSSEMQQLVKSAARRLPGLRLCVEGHEDGRITHLIIGSERRTLKVLLAISTGAYFLSPSWASDSLAANEWLPEDQFPARTRFTQVAERVREQLAAGTLVRPLEGHMVFIHVPTNATGSERSERPSERRHTLQRLVQALGGKVAPVRTCTMCIACEDVRRPKGMPEDVKMIRDEWLFLVAENYQQVGLADHIIGEEEAQ